LPCGEKKGLRFSNARITLSGMRKIKRKKKKDKKLEENGTIEREEKNETTILSHCNDDFGRSKKSFFTIEKTNFIRIIKL